MGIWTAILGLCLIIPWIIAQCLKVEMEPQYLIETITTVLAVIGLLVISFFG